jgi:hypothetical protein
VLNYIKIIVVKPIGRWRWKDDVKIGLTELGCEDLK